MSMKYLQIGDSRAVVGQAMYRQIAVLQQSDILPQLHLQIAILRLNDQ